MTRPFQLALCLVLSGCATRLPVPGSKAAAGINAGTEAWASVLRNHVDGSGRVDFNALALDSSDLEAFVHWVSVTSVESFPKRSDQLAFLINAYNGLAMYAAVRSGDEPRQKIRFFLLTKVPFAGGHTSLYTLENSAIRTLDEPRVHFVLNCMVRSCPRLPQEPLEGTLLDAQLDRAAREFLNDPRRVRVDLEGQTAHLSKILKWYRKDYLVSAPNLLTYINQYRDEPIPLHFRIKYLPYDWTRNDQ